MEEQDEADLALQRASKWAIARLSNRLSLLNESNPHNSQLISANRILPLLDIFQEDPQQLDPTLKENLPLLVQRYLDLIREASRPSAPSPSRAQSTEIAKILAHLCKVRGAKIVARFLNNEPQVIEPILSTYDRMQSRSTKSSELNSTAQEDLVSMEMPTIPEPSWQEEYIILLWLGHLMLTPFDLATISTDLNLVGLPDCSPDFKVDSTISSIASQIILIALPKMTVADKRQLAAASLLVRVVTRPDSIKLGLLDTTVQWALNRLELVHQKQDVQVHELVGLLSFMNGIVSSSDISRTEHFLPRLLKIITILVDEEARNARPLVTSAVAKRIAIKIQRNIVLQLLPAQLSSNIDTMAILEDVVDFLLRALKDRDTQVRRAASKALSMIACKVDAGMAEDIVEAVLGSLNEDVLTGGGSKSLQAVHPLRWHGLTLTLSQMLFRRSAAPSQLSSVLQALFSALAFEQRSAAGSSIGGNVRDAANFGLWALARRYTTMELNAVNIKEQESLSQFAGYKSVLQLTACHLLSAACLDPVGNVRRGSSAALQELIGRHPDTISDGIALVQTVDYQGVGLIRRAMTEIAFSAAKLNPLYTESLLRDLLTWRGIGALNHSAREFASHGLGKIGTLLAKFEMEALVQNLKHTLGKQPRNEAETKHGLIFALSCIVQSTHNLDVLILNSIWDLFVGSLALQKEDLATVSLRPQLVSSAVLHLMAALAASTEKQNRSGGQLVLIPANARAVLNLCLLHVGESDHEIVTNCVRRMAICEGRDASHAQIEHWISQLRDLRMAYRAPALMIALGAIWAQIDRWSDDMLEPIIITLTDIVEQSEDIEARVTAIKGLGLILEAALKSPNFNSSQCDHVMVVLEKSLDDYTINERGDVGSLLRGETLSVFPHAYAMSMRLKVPRVFDCLWACYRLATEKLHKTRVQAFQCLTQIDASIGIADTLVNKVTIADVSTYHYFRKFAQRLPSSSWRNISLVDEKQTVLASVPNVRPNLIIAILEGFGSSSGSGPDDILELSRSALLDTLEEVISTEDGESLDCISQALLSLLRNALATERTLLSTMEILNFLLEAGSLQRLFSAVPNTDLLWAKLFALVQKAHFKSKSLPKLLVAIDIYRTLSSIIEVRAGVVGKLTNMLSHPFPKVRLAAAETLWTVTGETELKAIAFAKAAPSKDFVANFRAKHCSS